MSRKGKIFFGILPHILFVGALVLAFMPPLVEIESKYSYIAVLIITEAAFLINRKKPSAIGISSVMYLFFIIWEFFTTKSSFALENKTFYPAPENVFDVFRTDYPKIFEGILSSMWLLFLAFLFALLLGIILGIVVGWVKPIRDVVFPIVKVISPIPPVVYTPYVVALLPTFWSAQELVIFISLFFGVFMNVVLTVTNIDPKLMESAKTLNMKGHIFLFNILLPYCVPGVVRSLNVSLSTAFMVLTSAEMLGATKGLGWFVKYYADFVDYKRVVAGIIVIGIVVTLLNAVLALVEKKLVKWR